MRIGFAMLLVLASCQVVFPLEDPFKRCAEDSECTREGEQGSCDCGVCAFADPECPLSNRRWAVSAGRLAFQCVPLVDRVDARVFHTCARMSDGTGWCWGFNSEGQLGPLQPLGVDANVPVQLQLSNGDPMTEIEELRTSAGATCARFTNATVACWGSNLEGELGAGLPLGMGQRASDPQVVTDGVNPLSGVTALTMGYFHACARVGDDQLYCWGNGKKGQIGSPLLESSNIALKVNLPAGRIRNISAGGEHTCANVDAQEGRRTFCWGRTGQGRLGADDTNDEPRPMPLPVVNAAGPLGDAFEIAAGNRHTCMIKEGDQIHCWGDNSHGQLGDGTIVEKRSAIQIPANDRSAQRVAGGDAHTCAITEDVVQCWGIDRDGEVGDGDDDGADELTPRIIDFDIRQIELTVGHAHSCSIGLDRKLHCWGLSDHGELGLEDTLPRTSPTEVPAARFCLSPD